MVTKDMPEIEVGCGLVGADGGTGAGVETVGCNPCRPHAAGAVFEAA